MPYLSIVIPAYNEAKRLPDTLTLLKEYLDKHDFASEVLVVDDGSTDETVKIVKDRMSSFPNLKIIENAVNKGKGGVVRQGMLAAAGDYCIFMDADHSTPIGELDKLLKETDKADIIIGSRYLVADSIKIKQPQKRRILSRSSNWLIQLLVLPGVKDTQCGFKLFSHASTQAISPLQKMSGWLFDVELLNFKKLNKQ